MPWFMSEETQDTRMGGFSPEGESNEVYARMIGQGLRNVYVTAAGGSPYSCSLMGIGEDPAMPEGVVMGIALNSPSLHPRIRELALEIIAIQDAQHQHCKARESN